MSMSDLSPAPRPVTGRFVLLCLVSFFGVVIAVNVIMARFALSTFGGVETASSYKAGLAFRSEELAAQAQSARDWHVDVVLTELGGEGRALVVTVRDHDGKPVSALETEAELLHPTDARRDVPVLLTPAGAGTYRAELDAPAGAWVFSIDLSQGGERLFRSKNRITLR